MSMLGVALWAEALKVRRSMVPWLTALGFCLAPLVGGLFMVILKDPARARSMGLISAKAQLSAGAADWPTLLGMQIQATAIAGTLLFTVLTAWIFGREFSDHTAKELLAVPTPRAAIVGAKLIVVAGWSLAMTALVGALGLAVGAAVVLPGWTPALGWRAAGDLLVTAALALALMPPVALIASAGRGYLPPMGWAFLTVFLAQILAAVGWGDWFPWSVPALYSELAGPRAGLVGPHSYALVLAVCGVGLAGTFWWWRSADQVR